MDLKKIRHALFNMCLFTSFNLTVIVFPHFPCFNTENKYLYQSGNCKWVTKASESTMITKMTKIIRFISHQCFVETLSAKYISKMLHLWIWGYMSDYSVILEKLSTHTNAIVYSFKKFFFFRQICRFFTIKIFEVIAIAVTNQRTIR